MTAPEFTRPPEIAREALRRLALERVSPTPDNYRAFYHQIAGTPAEDAFPEKSLKLIAGALPRHTPEALRLACQFEDAVARGQWPAVRQVIVGMCDTGTASQPAWGPLIRDLVGELDLPLDPQAGARRRAALQQTLAGAPADAEQLHLRLQRLLRGWSQPGTESQAPAAQSASPNAILPLPLATLLTHLLRRGILPMVEDNPTLAAEVRDLADTLAGRETAGRDGPPAEDLAVRVQALALKLEWSGEDQRAIRHGLLGLLKLVVDNISELVIDDHWLHGQLALLTEAFARPLDIRMLDEVERRLRDVIDKQRHLKRQLTDAQARLKHMLAGFIDRLTLFSVATNAYHDTLEHCAQDIQKAEDITQLGDVVETLLHETRQAQANARRSGEELNELRAEVEAANKRIARLQCELDAASELVRHDPLTGALNRKGLDEALAREIARARRRASSLCLALLDVDNFKHINDTYGHKTGDDALRHLAGVVRDCLRPQDSVGRYGGEEFLILLPETDLEQANSILTRLQRELTKRFFLADDRRLLITFSAGIARLAPEEDPHAAIDRADKAMYAAKRAGKNRVLVAS